MLLAVYNAAGGRSIDSIYSIHTAHTRTHPAVKKTSRSGVLGQATMTTRRACDDAESGKDAAVRHARIKSRSRRSSPHCRVVCDETNRGSAQEISACTPARISKAASFSLQLATRSCRRLQSPRPLRLEGQPPCTVRITCGAIQPSWAVDTPFWLCPSGTMRARSCTAGEASSAHLSGGMSTSWRWT